MKNETLDIPLAGLGVEKWGVFSLTGCLPWQRSYVRCAGSAHSWVTIRKKCEGQSF